MKQKDILVIVTLVIISAVISYFVSSKIFVPPEDRKAQVEVVEPITTEFNQPNKLYFNDKSINPTKTIEIGAPKEDAPKEQNQ